MVKWLTRRVLRTRPHSPFFCLPKRKDQRKRQPICDRVFKRLSTLSSRDYFWNSQANPLGIVGSTQWNPHRHTGCSTESVQPSSVAKCRFWKKECSIEDYFRIKIGLIFLLLFLSRKKVNSDFREKVTYAIRCELIFPQFNSSYRRLGIARSLRSPASANRQLAHCCRFLCNAYSFYFVVKPRLMAAMSNICH